MEESIMQQTHHMPIDFVAYLNNIDVDNEKQLDFLMNELVYDDSKIKNDRDVIICKKTIMSNRIYCNGYNDQFFK